MKLRFYNYLSRKKEAFKPLRRSRVGLYTCGPTVYNFAHIGNLRTYVFEDLLRRTLENTGFRVMHIMNITDIDDKIIRDSKAAGKSLKEFTTQYTKEFFKDISALNILPAHNYTRATDHIAEMIRLIQKLLRKKIAYRAEDGVYYSIAKFKPYGKLSRLKQRELKPGARIAVDEYDKTRVEDFALWKTKKPGEPSWKAPVGEGHPGWHIECSAMSMKYLGPTFDIHTGGVDNIFPHHENEIAQSEGATGKKFVNYFIEGEHLLVGGKKMAKSLGNFYTLRDIIAKGFEALDFRYLVLGTHYRTKLNFTWESLAAAREARLGALRTTQRLQRGPFGGSLRDENEALKVIAKGEEQFAAYLSDDLNAPRGLATFNTILKYANSMLDKNLLTDRAAKAVLGSLWDMDKILGLRIKEAKPDDIPQDVQKLVTERESARSAKNWQKADELRAKLKSLGYAVEDTSCGPLLSRI